MRSGRMDLPIDAAARGSGSNRSKTSSGGPPSSSRTTSAASAYVIGGASAWRRASVSRYGSGIPASTYDTICASFIMAPFIAPIAAVTSSAVLRWKAARSRSRSSSSRPTSRMRLATQRLAARDVSRAATAVRPMRAPRRRRGVCRSRGTGPQRRVIQP